MALRVYATQMDIDRYLARIGMCAAPARDATGLAALQEAHRRAIAFENLDIPLGRGIAIDPGAVYAKLVQGGRGGYCFEHNRLLADALAALGFEHRSLLARVRLGLADGNVPARTHVCLLVSLDGKPWLADAGFGGSNVPPLPLEDGAQASTADGARHRLVAVGPAGTLAGEWRLERAGPALATDGRSEAHSDWQAQYTFDLAHVAQGDLEQANHWTATRPGTRFTTMHIASRPLADGFASMTDRALTIYRTTGVEQRTIADSADYAATLQDVFGIALGEDQVSGLRLFRA